MPPFQAAQDPGGAGIIKEFLAEAAPSLPGDGNATLEQLWDSPWPELGTWLLGIPSLEKLSPLRNILSHSYARGTFLFWIFIYCVWDIYLLYPGIFIYCILEYLFAEWTFFDVQH